MIVNWPELFLDDRSNPEWPGCPVAGSQARATGSGPERLTSLPQVDPFDVLPDQHVPRSDGPASERSEELNHRGTEDTEECKKDNQ